MRLARRIEIPVVLALLAGAIVWTRAAKPDHLAPFKRYVIDRQDDLRQDPSSGECSRNRLVHLRGIKAQDVATTIKAGLQQEGGWRDAWWLTPGRVERGELGWMHGTSQKDSDQYLAITVANGTVTIAEMQVISKADYLVLKLFDRPTGNAGP